MDADYSAVSPMIDSAKEATFHDVGTPPSPISVIPL
jgi:hypothetical protein